MFFLKYPHSYSHKNLKVYHHKLDYMLNFFVVSFCDNFDLISKGL